MQASAEGGVKPNKHCLPKGNFCQLDLDVGLILYGVEMVGLDCLVPVSRETDLVVFFSKNLVVVGRLLGCFWTRTWLFLDKDLIVFGRLLGCLRVAEQLSSPCCSYFTLRCSQTECDKR